MPELRQAPTQAHHLAGDRVQGHGLVQDGLPWQAAERGRRAREDREEVRGQDRDEDRDEGDEERRQAVRRREGAGEDRGEIVERTIGATTGVLTTARAISASFFADECLFLAGGVAYQLFFALIPLLALVVGVLGFVYGSDRAQRELVQLLREIYPSASQQEVRIARELVDGRAISLGIGVVGTI